jgi:hypothetical protein
MVHPCPVAWARNLKQAFVGFTLLDVDQIFTVTLRAIFLAMGIRLIFRMTIHAGGDNGGRFVRGCKSICALPGVQHLNRLFGHVAGQPATSLIFYFRRGADFGYIAPCAHRNMA